MKVTFGRLAGYLTVPSPCLLPVPQAGCTARCHSLPVLRKGKEFVRYQVGIPAQ